MNLPTPKKPKFVILDLDGTLIHETLFPQVLDLMKALKKAQHHLSIASHNAYAEFFCKRYGLDELVDHIIGQETYPDMDKTPHLTRIAELYIKAGIIVNEEDMILVDDRLEVINDTRALMPNVSYIHVVSANGMCKNDIKHLIT